MTGDAAASVTVPAHAAYNQLDAVVAAAADTADDLLRAGLPELAGLQNADMAWRASLGAGPAVTANISQQLLSSEQFRSLPQLLIEPGSLLLAASPNARCCNEPSCCCLDKPSELQLASGKGSKCSGCGAARYCCKECQVKHWAKHKPACKAISAAATPAAKAGRKSSSRAAR